MNPRRTRIPTDQLPHMVITRHRWIMVGIACAGAGLVSNMILAVLAAFGVLDARSLTARLGWAAAWGFMMAVSACNMMAILSIRPRWGTITYTHGHMVPVTFRLDPDRAEGTYRAYLRGTDTPLTVVDNMAHIRLNGAQLTHSIRLGPHTVRIIDLMRYSDGITFVNPPPGGRR